MSKIVDFYYDYGSPTSYLAFKQLPALCRKYDAELNYKPVLLGGIFKLTGNASPMTVDAKGRYMMADMARFAQRQNVEMHFNPHFPINTLGLMRGAFVAIALNKLEAYNTAVFDAFWAAQKNMGSLDVVAAVLNEANLPADELMQRAQTEIVKTALKDATATAVERGLFGCPTMFVGNDMFFGQDRLDFMAQALAK